MIFFCQSEKKLSVIVINKGMKHLFIISIFLSLYSFSCKTNETFVDFFERNKGQENLVPIIQEYEREHPKDFCSKALLANLFVYMNDYENAEKYLKLADEVYKPKFKKDFPEYVQSYFATKSTIFGLKKDYDRAITYIDYAIDLNDAQESFYSHKAQLLMNQGKFVESSEIYKKIVFDENGAIRKNIHKDNLVFLCLVSNELGDYETAYMTGKRFFVLGEYFPGFCITLSTLAEKLGKKSEALEFLFWEFEFSRENKNILEEKLESFRPLLSETLLFKQVEAYLYNKPLPKCHQKEFIDEYLKVRLKAGKEILPDEIIYSFIKLEPLFSKNISFYWSLWNIFSFQKFGKIEDGKKALEIISVLAPKSDYGTQAKTLLQEL